MKVQFLSDLRVAEHPLAMKLPDAAVDLVWDHRPPSSF